MKNVLRKAKNYIMKSIELTRRQLEEVDQEIVKLFEKRVALSEEEAKLNVLGVNQNQNKTVYLEKLNRLKNSCEDEFICDNLDEFFGTIEAICSKKNAKVRNNTMMSI